MTRTREIVRTEAEIARLSTKATPTPADLRNLASAKATLLKLQSHDPATLAVWKRIADLTEHLKSHKKDHASRRGLLMLVAMARCRRYRRGRGLRGAEGASPGAHATAWADGAQAVGRGRAADAHRPRADTPRTPRRRIDRVLAKASVAAAGAKVLASPILRSAA